MAHKKTSAEKRHEQSERRRMRNKAVKSRVRTSVKHFLEAVDKKDQTLAQEKLRVVQSELDNAYRKGVVKRNPCARKKSRMFRLYNKTFVEQTKAE